MKANILSSWWVKFCTHVKVKQVPCDEEAERVQHTSTLDDCLTESQRYYIMSLWLQLTGVGGGSEYSYGILAPPSLHEIRIKSLLFPKFDYSFVI